jgi:hypothetical protein
MFFSVKSKIRGNTRGSYKKEERKMKNEETFESFDIIVF